MSNFKDLFSVQAKDYVKYRPTYPKELFAYLGGLGTERRLCWDVGTGNGQAAFELAKFFSAVYATDPSEKQIREAIPTANVRYAVENSLTPSLAPNSVDLITVAQAFHWFKHREFADVVARVAAPGAHLAVWCYAILSVNPEVDAAMDTLYTGILDSYWEPERRLVEEGYRSISLPFPELAVPTIGMRAEWSLEQLLGYFSTWSALQNYLKKNTSVAVDRAFDDLRAAWGTAPTRTVTWPLSLRVWKVK